MIEDVKDNVRNETLETLKFEYKEVHAYWRILTDIRFKLLAFVPTLAGLGVVLIPNEPLGAFAVGLLGFIATLGITFYDQRNTELYNASIHRAAVLEREITKFKATRMIKCYDGANVGGIFCLRPKRGRKFLGILMYHDRGLSMVYASALGAWLFIIINSILKLIFWPLTFSLLLAALLAIVIYLILQWPERSKYLFSIATKFEGELNNGSISEELKKEFKNHRFSLPDNATVKKEKKGEITERLFIISWQGKQQLSVSSVVNLLRHNPISWKKLKSLITDEKKFIIRKGEGKLTIYGSGKPREGARGGERD